jgi:uncharacterized membrane protein
MPFIVYVLYILAFMNGLTGLVGFGMALALKANASPAVQTHYRFQIITFFGALILGAVGVGLVIVGIPLSLIGVGLVLMTLAAGVFGLAGLYMVVRAIIGLAKLAGGEPYPNPESWTV